MKVRLELVLGLGESRCGFPKEKKAGFLIIGPVCLLGVTLNEQTIVPSPEGWRYTFLMFHPDAGVYRPSTQGDDTHSEL